MNVVVQIEQLQIQRLPDLVRKVARALDGATNAAEVLDAHERADVALDAARIAARWAKKEAARDELFAVAARAEADLLEVRANASRRYYEETQAAIARGEIPGRGGDRGNQHTGGKVSDVNFANSSLHKRINHEGKMINLAEEADPGIVRRSLEERLAAGHEPTKAYLRDVVNEAALEALQGRGQRRDNKNPLHRANPAFDAVVGLNGACRRANDLIEEYGPEAILGGCVDAAMRARSIVLLEACRDNLNRVLESANA